MAIDTDKILEDLEAGIDLTPIGAVEKQLKQLLTTKLK